VELGGSEVKSGGSEVKSGAQGPDSLSIDYIDYVTGIGNSLYYTRSAQLLPSLGKLASLLHPLLGPCPQQGVAALRMRVLPIPVT
jgi:hypothetical protein